MNIIINAKELAINLYIKGHGITHAVRLANADAANIFKKAYPNKEINPDIFTNVHNVAYVVSRKGLTHYYSKAYNPDQIEKMKKEFANGKTKAQLARDYGVTYPTMVRYLES